MTMLSTTWKFLICNKLETEFSLLLPSSPDITRKYQDVEWKLRYYYKIMDFRNTTPYPEHTGPRALSSAGPCPSEPPLRPESGRTPLHQDSPTRVRGGRLEVWVRLLKRRRRKKIRLQWALSGTFMMGNTINEVTVYEHMKAFYIATIIKMCTGVFQWNDTVTP